MQFRKTLEIEPNFPMAHSGLGLAYEQEHDFAKAREEYRFALAQNPGSSFWLAMLAPATSRPLEKPCAN